MKFEDYKLKTDQYGFKFAKEDIMLGNNECSCFTCHAPTKFIEINAEAPFCSDECVDEENDEWDSVFVFNNYGQDLIVQLFNYIGCNANYV